MNSKIEKAVTTALVIVVVTWALATCIGCSGFKFGVYGERVDTIETKYVTTPPKTGMADAVYDWLFVDHSDKEGRKA